ncbi:glycosyltransferase [Noviherbaspirillum sp. ST9]|uniref:glycosyltransferase n=1 Tax=Noviherbaspirillum sp. ST9 TaxID=3401606 RepID=UPI003B586831
MIGHAVPRVLWLLNHDAARRFDVAMLKRIGISEIFLPKRYPNDPNFPGASVDWSCDADLRIPAEALDILNAADWYGDPGDEAWEVANQYFDVMFFTLHHPEFIHPVSRRFRGIALWRAYGMPDGTSHSHVLQARMNRSGEPSVRALGNRFFFAQAYEHLHENEDDLLASRRLHLPLALHDGTASDDWRGNDERLFFVCPRIGINPYYKAAYLKFKEDFKGLPLAIAGEQPIRVDDPRVLGFIDREAYERSMREMRVMFYHGSDPYHVHNSPFEAVRAGVPLVFMAGGMLDRLGGKALPGRCERIDDARRKIERILGGDRKLIEELRQSQVRLLDRMRPDACEEAWRNAFGSVMKNLRSARATASRTRTRKPRIAVIVPVNYRGGSLSGAKLLANAIDIGARQECRPVDVVFGHLDDPNCYTNEEFADLSPTVVRRPYKWEVVSRNAALRALAYAGREQFLPAATYQVPEDGMKQFMDCDLWVIVSDRLEHPILPLRPHVLMVFDYLQRYQPLLRQDLNKSFIAAAHQAERIFVTTEFTRQDALQYAGLGKERVVRLPMLARRVKRVETTGPEAREPSFFLWTTNLAPHKNHANALKALDLYYSQLGGQLVCCVSGVGTDKMFKSDLSHLKPLRRFANNPYLKRQLRLLGELSDHAYQERLANARFLWHAGWIDNGTFSVVEAAQLGVPSLSSDYPAMREMDAQFDLNLAWMDAHDPEDMAARLKEMELRTDPLRNADTSGKQISLPPVEHLAGAYWKAVSTCL